MSNQLGTPVIFGEVLFDCFPDGASVLGGAPFNVACHLQGFGLSPLFISRVGDDEQGGIVKQTMAEWGMNLDGVQEDSKHGTGQVEIKLKQGQPEFSILPHQAYDFIDAQQVLNVVRDVDVSLLYHGTLALRERNNVLTFDALKDALTCPIFLDINLRAPWWNIDKVLQLTKQATWLKLNNEEMTTIYNLDSLTTDSELTNYAMQICQDNNMEFCILTLGEQGARICSAQESLTGEPVKPKEIKDTVGAGDAFSSIVMMGRLLNWPSKKILECALEFASAICEVRGATVFDMNFYNSFKERWQIIE